MTHSRLPFAKSPLGELIGAVASEEVSPGAGAAGAISLALAAACAGKAVAITLKRGHGNARLTQARDQLADIGRLALVGADEDASRFEDFIRKNDANAGTELLKAEERLQKLADTLGRILSDIECSIDPVMAGDIAAARALCDAFMVIQRRNLDETRRAT